LESLHYCGLGGERGLTNKRGGRKKGGKNNREKKCKGAKKEVPKL